MSPKTKTFENCYPRTTTENKDIDSKSSIEIRENTLKYSKKAGKDERRNNW